MPPLSSQELAGITPMLTINSQQSSQCSNSSNSLMRLSQENQFDSSLYYPLINNEAPRQSLSSKQQQLSKLNPLQIIRKNSIETTPFCSINNSVFTADDSQNIENTIQKSEDCAIICNAKKSPKRQHLVDYINETTLSEQKEQQISVICPILNDMSNTPLMQRRLTRIADNGEEEIVFMTNKALQTSFTPQTNFKTPTIPIRLSNIKKRADQFTPSDFNQYRRSSPRLASLKNSSLALSMSSTSNLVNKRKRSFNEIDLGSPLCASTPIVRKNVRK